MFWVLTGWSEGSAMSAVGKVLFLGTDTPEGMGSSEGGQECKPLNITELSPQPPENQLASVWF